MYVNGTFLHPDIGKVEYNCYDAIKDNSPVELIFDLKPTELFSIDGILRDASFKFVLSHNGWKIEEVNSRSIGVEYIDKHMYLYNKFPSINDVSALLLKVWRKRILNEKNYWSKYKFTLPEIFKEYEVKLTDESLKKFEKETDKIKSLLM
jgi:hypothetical protein